MRPRVTQKPPKGHVTIQELAGLTSIPASTLKDWVERRHFPIRRFNGRRIAISREAWNAFAAEHGQPTVDVEPQAKAS